MANGDQQEISEKLSDFLAKAEHIVPTVHDELTRYELRKRGWQLQDTREDTQLLRIVSLASQKFMADVIHSSLQIHKQRRRQAQTRLKEQGLHDQKTVLMMEDLSEALQEYGVNLKPVPYFLDSNKTATAQK